MEPIPQKFTFRQKMHYKNLEAFFYSDPQPVCVPPHQHDFYELYLFIDGRGGQIQYQAGDDRFELAPCDILLIPPHTVHFPVFLQYPSEYRRVVLWFTEDSLSAIGLSPELFFGADAAAGAMFYRFSPTISCYLLETACAVVQEFYSFDSFSRLLAYSYFEKLLALIGRYSAQQIPNASDLSRDQLVNKVIFFINHNLSKNLSLDEIASNCFASKYYLSREFKRCTGITVHQYIQQRRLLWAKNLLANGYMPTDVYKRCGFHNYSTFFKAFTASYGISPKSIFAKAQESLSGITNTQPSGG